MGFNVVFDLDEPSKPGFHGVLMHFRWLKDHDAPFHLALDHVDFGVSSALQRRFPDDHFPLDY